MFLYGDAAATPPAYHGRYGPNVFGVSGSAMAATNESVDHILGLLAEVEPVAKRMFGGLGIFHQGLMFALMDEDTLYMKVDDENRPAYEAEGSEPFSVTMRGREMTMGYYEVPASVLDEPGRLTEWAKTAIDVAKRADAAKPKSKRKFK